MNILFLGTPEFAVPSLELLIDSPDIVIKGVLTQPDRPKGRNLVVTPPPVKITAEKHGLTVYQPKKSNDILEDLRSLKIDLMVVVSFGEILTKEVLAVPKLGAINLHPSLLPKYRGAAPLSWTLINGDTVTGNTTFWISEKMDSGDIIMQKEEPVKPDDTLSSLSKRMSKTGAELISDTVLAIAKGDAKRIPQNKEGITYAPKLKKKDGEIDWSQEAKEIHNKVRGMNPWPGAYTFFKGKRLEILKSSVLEEKHELSKAILIEKEGFGIGAGNGTLKIEELKPEGKKAMKAIDFIHGYGITDGTVFGQ